MATFNDVDTFSELMEAIALSKGNAQADEINITGNITLSGLLPLIEEDTGLKINGGDFTISGNNQHRLFFVKSGTVTFDELTFAEGLAQGSGGSSGGAGMGGALFVYDGTVAVTRSAFVENRAIGGSTSDFAYIEKSRGGGAGFVEPILGEDGTPGRQYLFGKYLSNSVNGGTGSDLSNVFGGYGGNGGIGGFGGGQINDTYTYGTAADGGEGGFGNGGNAGNGGFGGRGGDGGDASGGFSYLYVGYFGGSGEAGNGGDGGFGGGGGSGGLGPTFSPSSARSGGGFGGNGGYGGGAGPSFKNDGYGGDGGFGGGENGAEGNYSTPIGGGGAGFGGAIFLRSGSLTVADSSFTDNTAAGSSGGDRGPFGTEGGDGKGLGGAIFAMKFTENTNGNNQGMPDQLPTVNLLNVTFSGNATADSTSATTPTDILSGADDLNTADIFGATVTRTTDVAPRLIPLSATKAVQINDLGADNTVRLRLENSGVENAREILVFSADANGGNRMQVAAFTLLEGGQLPADYDPVFTLDRSLVVEGTFLQFEVVGEDGSTQLFDPAAGQNGQVRLASGNTAFTLETATAIAPINLLKGDAAAIDLTGQPGEVTLKFSVYREAAFNNVIRLYTTDDADGGITDPLSGSTLRPGDPGYPQAAVDRQLNIALSGTNGEVNTFTAQVEGGGFLGSFLIANGYYDSTFAPVYFSHPGANGGGNDYVKLLGDNTFGFEDLPNLGDQDYNDMVVQFSVV